MCPHACIYPPYARVLMSMLVSTSSPPAKPFVKVGNPIHLLFLSGHLYLSGMCFGLAPRMDMEKKKKKNKGIRLHVLDMMTILVSIYT